MSNIRSNEITPEQKAQIISESFESGCVVSELARSYGISEKTLHGWRRKERQKRKAEELLNNSPTKFIELALQEPVKHEVNCGILKKAELTFSDFSLSIEGSISSSKLITIVQILNKSC